MIRAALERHGLLARRRARERARLRVLPLGGLGEIGKNMTVVEYDGRIVVVDVGLRFPTAEMLGHRPRAARLRLPARARRRHRGDRRHARPRGPPRRAAVGPARAGRGQRAGRLRRRRSPMAMARSKLDEHTPEGRRRSRSVDAGRDRRARPVRRRAGPHDPLDPGLDAPSRSPPSSAPILRHRRLQVRPDARSTASPPTSRAWPSSGREGLLLLCGDSTNADRPGFVALGVRRRARTWRRSFARCEGRIVVTCFASNIHRVQQVVRRRRRARPQGRAGRPLDAQEREHRPHARPHRGPGGHARAGRARSRTSPTRSS